MVKNIQKYFFILIGLCFFLSPRAFAAPAIVQTNYSSVYPFFSEVVLTGTTSGHTIVATALNGNNANTISISGCGNNWTQILNNATTSNGVFDAWMTVAPGGTCDASATPSASNNTTLFSLTEISGINGTDTVPAVFLNSNCTTCQTATTTPTTNGDLIFVWNTDAAQFQTFSNYTNGFTQFAQGTSTSNGQQNTAWSTAYLVQSSAAPISTSYQISTESGYSQNIIMAFKSPDLTPPSVTLLSPPSGSIVSSTVTLSASSTDNVAVSGVQFQIDGVNLGSEITATSGPTIYTTSWNTASSTDGTHIISAIAYDTSNNSSTATSSVIVHNASLNITTSTSLSFSATAGNTNPSSQSITIKNQGTPSSTLSWTATSTQSWLTFSSTSGSLPGSASTPINLIANPSGLSAGTYTATATITDANLSSSVVSLPISFIISAAITPPPSSPGVSVGVPASYGIPNYLSTTPTPSNASSTAIITSSLEAEIVSIQAELQSLLAEVPKPSFTFTRNLSLGMQGADVQALQQFLIQQNSGPNAEKLKANGMTEYFGILTYNALKEYQASVGLPTTGYFGTQTRTYIKIHSLPQSTVW